MADLLIRGMEMPKPGERRFALFVGADGVVDVYEARGGATLEYYLFETEAVELPDHGPLCDLNALDKAFTALRFNEDGSLKHWDDRKNWCLHGSEIEKLLAEADTIIPASKEGGE